MSNWKHSTEITPRFWISMKPANPSILTAHAPEHYE